MPRSVKSLVWGAVALCCGLDCSASSSSPAIDDADGGLAPVRIIRGDPSATRWFSLSLEGHGLANEEGLIVTVRTGVAERAPERLGSAQARIENGAFRIDLPQACEISLYKRKLLFIDVDSDGTCTAGVDRVYSDSRAQEGDLTLTLSDSVPAPAVDAAMRLATDAAAATPICLPLNEPWPDSWRRNVVCAVAKHFVPRPVAPEADWVQAKSLLVRIVEMHSKMSWCLADGDEDGDEDEDEDEDGAAN